MKIPTKARSARPARLSAKSTLASLMAGCFCSAHATDPILVAQASDQATRLPTVDVRGTPERSYSVEEATSATKTDTSILRTPASIQVIARTVLDDKQALSMPDAVNGHVSGVLGRTGGGFLYDNFIIRGFSGSGFGDAFRNGLYNRQDIYDLSNIERIEILKGPAAVLYGRIEPGGLVNYVTKKPQEGRYVALQQQIGSNSQYRTSIDATGAIDEARTLLYRVNGSYASNESFRDFVGNERVFIAPSLSWRPNQRFELNIDLEHKRDRFHPDIGIPAIGNRPAQVPLNRNLSDSPTREPITNTLVAFDWTYRLDENWAIKQRFLQQDWTLNAKQVLMGALQANDRTLARNLLLSTQDVDTRSTNLDLTGKVNFLGARHSLLFGIDGFAAQTRAHQFFGAGPTIDIFNPVYGQVNWDSVSRNNNFYRKESWTGLYAQDQITVADKLHVLLGGRYDRVKTGAISSPISMDAAKAARIERVDTEFSPRVGLLYQLTPGMSLYGSYTQSFGANNGVSVDGRAFSPQKGKQYEIGFKTESADKRLSSTVAIFDLTKYNMLTTDPNNAGFQILAGTAKSSGIEIDVSGQVSRQFSVLATYAYTDARYTVNNNGLRGNRLENAPAHQGSLWGVYQHSDAIRVGLGGVAVGLRQADANNTVQLPGFARLDAMASYLMRSGRSKLTAQLNAYNLTDKAYFANSSGGRNTSMPGAPRTFMVSLKYEY